MALTAPDALLAAASLHLGFQLTVTGLAYPALAEVPEGDWARAHSAHGRRVTPVVALVYGLLAAACLWTLAARPYDPLLLLAAAGAGSAALATALVAGPTHGRLSREGRSAERLRTLRRADGVRLGCALACAAAALGHAVLEGSA
ncbi:hypothetical protein [Motilibacter aurantiacus]|uniref:hypothetical protein n=1 Tax=Motilibacter aurantiacus TaxID=2714955 RepID=UPI00140C475F|nr:hypothetical protein [Motilibacter aurantiacus]NHC47584.1 hypothetical protein [Motilibacter aurantiacus]